MIQIVKSPLHSQIKHSGLTIGYIVELGSDDTDTAIDESSLSISGGFGKVVLGGQDGVGEAYGIGAKDIIAEEATPGVLSSAIGANADISMADSDLNKISYHLPAMGGLTAGVSFQDTGTNTGTDTTNYGARYTAAVAGDNTFFSNNLSYQLAVQLVSCGVCCALRKV